MTRFLTVLLYAAITLSLHAAKATFDFNSYNTGHTFPMLTTGGGSAKVTASPSGSGKAVEVTCGAYNNVPVFAVTLPDGITLGDCSSISAKIYIPSAGNEQYANYKQLLIYIDGTLAYKDTKADGSDDYPNQGDKDKWLTKTCSIDRLTLSAAQKAAHSLDIAIGLNDNKMKYYIAEINFGYDLNLDAPVLPEQGAYYTGRYRNIFAEAGYTEQQIQSRIDDLWHTYFEGDKSTERLYYESGADMAYILDVNNADVRTEGMSYGMMICVQLNRKQQFDALWKWAKTYMQFPANDERRGYFAWQCNTDGSKKGNTPASDGEEYFVTALMFASARWGDGEGIFNYSREAEYILEMSMEKPAADINPYSSYTQLFDPAEMQVVFVPYASAAKFTDPSYHLPAFYEIWASKMPTNKDFYKRLAAKSREMWPKFANPVTGLMPDYANFDGSAHHGDGDHADFLYDAWRCIMNMAVDYAWFKPEGVPYTELVDRMYRFFISKGITDYHSVYTLDGQNKNGNTDHSPGLVACNASGALATDSKDAWKFVENFYDTAIPTGSFRYYDGCLYFLNWLHCAGQYRIYTAGATTSATEIAAEPTRITFDGHSIRVAGGSGTYRIVALSSGITVAQGTFTPGTDIPTDALAPGIYAAVAGSQTLKFSIH